MNKAVIKRTGFVLAVIAAWFLGCVLIATGIRLLGLPTDWTMLASFGLGLVWGWVVGLGAPALWFKTFG